MSTVQAPLTPPSLPVADSALRELEQVAHDFVRFASAPPPDVDICFSETVARMHALVARARGCEIVGLPRPAILEAVGPVREVYAASPFMRHIQTWPRGYQGDFEVVEHLVGQKNLAAAGTVAFQVERYCLMTGLAQQHRNKVARQAELIERAVLDRAAEDRTGPAKVLLVACGGSPDVLQALPVLSRFPSALVLNDLDAGALEHSAARLGVLGDRVVTVNGNALTRVNRLAKYGPYDLVLAGGLFDYLSDRQVIHFLGKAYAKLLKPGGTLFFSNIAKGNPYRVFIEYFGSWFLTERDEADVSRFCSTLPLRIKVERDFTGLALLVEARRAEA